MTLPATLPPVIPEPWAQNANPANINTIPATTSTPGLASYDLGFPPVTMQAVIAGGIPPEGQDFNGILFAVTSHLYWTQSGQLFPYESAVATAIGGYAQGTLLGSTDGVTQWLSLVNNNMDNPDTTGNTSWVAAQNYGALGINVSNANVTLTPQQAKFKLLIFVGVLTANVSIIFPPLARDWLLVNLTTGSFALTARLAASVGVNVPQGGYANPLGIYGGAVSGGSPQLATEIYPTVAPLGIPISQGPDPLTLAERTNAGYILATYFNQNSPSNENPVIGSIFVEANTGDGYLRKATLAYVESVMLLQAIGGAVTAAQVPVGAVTQYTPQILASAALTGTPTAPTQTPGTANTTVATTAFVNPGSSLAANGYRRNPDGTIDQWGSVNFTANGGTTAIGFNIPFPSACYGVEVTVIAPSGLGGAGSYQAFVLAAPGTTSFSYRSVSSANPAITLMWRAIGS